jgi:isoquinoline 1-oxidoreductase beta subunit
MVAEELECDWARVTTEYPTPGQNLARNRVWGNFSTGGSRGIRESQDYVRKGGAAARMMLVQAAANGWGVQAAECRVAAGVITHPGSGRRTTYGQVAAAAAKLPVPANPALKDPKDWKLVGARLARLDTVEKTTGALVYGADLKLPGMLNAAIRDCPVFGGKVRSFDARAIASRPGVRKVLKVGDSAVAVVADTWWRAKTALDALPIDWDVGPNAAVQQAAIDATLKAGLDAADAAVGNRNGDAKEVIAKATRKVEAVYSYPFQNRGLDARALRGLDAHPERRVGACGHGRCRRAAPGEMRRLQAAAGRGLRAPGHGRLGHTSGADRARDAGNARQAPVDA